MSKYEYKTIINAQGDITFPCVLIKDGVIQNYSLMRDEQAVKYLSKNFLKPFWTGSEWEESATEEEIRQWKEENKIIDKEPTEKEELINNLIVDNLNMQIQIDSLIQSNLGGN